MSIFPNSCYDVENKIFSYVDSASALQFSMVCKAANTFLSNDSFFSKHFKKEMNLILNNPKLEKLSNSSEQSRIEDQQLIHFLPNICWKIACCALSNLKIEIEPSLIEEQRKNIPQFLLNYKRKLEGQNKKIC